MMKVKTLVARGDTSGYYLTRWDTAVPVTVIADTKDEAEQKAKDFMGDPGFGRYWSVSIKSVEEV